MTLRAITPQIKATQRQYKQAAIKGMDRYTKLVLREFEETVQTWSEKPPFTRTVSSTNTRITGEVYTKNKVYGYVNNGTKDHFVAPRRARALAFRSKYRAKTRPGRIPSGSGGASGNIVFSRGHFVRGIDEREFDKQIKDDTKKRFEDWMLEAIGEEIGG